MLAAVTNWHPKINNEPRRESPTSSAAFQKHNRQQHRHARPVHFAVVVVALSLTVPPSLLPHDTHRASIGSALKKNKTRVGGS